MIFNQNLNHITTTHSRAISEHTTLLHSPCIVDYSNSDLQSVFEFSFNKIHAHSCALLNNHSQLDRLNHYYRYARSTLLIPPLDLSHPFDVWTQIPVGNESVRILFLARPLAISSHIPSRQEPSAPRTSFFLPHATSTSPTDCNQIPPRASFSWCRPLSLLLPSPAHRYNWKKKLSFLLPTPWPGSIVSSHLGQYPASFARYPKCSSDGNRPNEARLWTQWPTLLDPIHTYLN